MISYRPVSTYIDLGTASVNIGTLRSISYHVQCLNSQQLYNITPKMIINRGFFPIKPMDCEVKESSQGDISLTHTKHMFLAHLSRRLMGELIVYQSLRRPSVRLSVRQHFQTSSPLKPLGQLNSNFIWRLLRTRERKFVQMVMVT